MIGSQSWIDSSYASTWIKIGAQTSLPDAPWGWRKGPWVKEMQEFLEAEKYQEVDSSLKFPKGVEPCWHLDFSLVRRTLDF